MEKNKMSLKARIDAEYAERNQKYGLGHGTTGTDYDPNETLAEREARQSFDAWKRQLDSAVDMAINSSLTFSESHGRLLVFPQIMARHGVFGSNTVLNILHNPQPKDMDSMKELMDEFNAFNSRFKYGHTVHRALDLKQHAFFLKDNYSEKTRNLGECFWLLKLCDWLGCTLPVFKHCMDEILTAKPIIVKNPTPDMANFHFSQVGATVSMDGDGSPPPPTLEFALYFKGNVPTSMSNPSIHLQEESLAQYRELENLLSRL